MSLRLRLMISYIVVAAFVSIVGIIGIITANQIIEADKIIISSTTPTLNALAQIESQGSKLAQSANQFALFGLIADDDEVEHQAVEEEQFAQDKAELFNWLDQLKAITNEPETYQEVEAITTAYLAGIQNLIDTAKSEANVEELHEVTEAIEETEIEFNTVMSAAIAEENAEFQQNIIATDDAARAAIMTNVVSMIVVMGMASLLGWLIAQRIVKPIIHLHEVSLRMTNGDYSQRSQFERKDELGQLSTAFNTMASAIQERNLALSASNTILEQRIDERTKELRIATREAQEASRLKDEFLAIMSHELRTPLNAMIGFQGILLMTAKLDEKAQHMVRRAQANAHRLLTLINDILDVSRIESGRMQFVKSEVGLHDLVDRLESQMSVLADEKKLQFTVDIDPRLPATILIDEDALTKIITNLMGNAFKFTEKGGVDLKLTQRDSSVVITVQDTGIGIPTHMHNAIFERFRQVDGSSNRTHGGSGLGLAIVQKLVLALNGTINVQSVVGEGSAFTVVLPLETVSEKVAV
ncbi:MAG: HAMP domain-containing protein [Chloroflexi bacterium]|nr:HAMP domain-containing protein [Chloroflexota bacterium]